MSNSRIELEKSYYEYKQKGMKLDMSRGKPSTEQLDKLSGLLTEIASNSDCFSENGTDCRNYGCLEGIKEAKDIFAGMLETSSDNVVVCGNSSLSIMYDVISNGYMFGLNGCEPWCRQEGLKFLCPAPGYDRHFAISKKFGFNDVYVPMLEDGPDMEAVRKYVENDPKVKGIWCVPKYSNPTGVTYSDDVVRAIASLKPAAPDFIVIWDNAYAVHDLTDTPDKLLPLMPEAEKTGFENHVYMFASTSKITWSGAGISCVAMSAESKKHFLDIMKVRTIGYDKLAMLRHARVLKAHLPEIMAGHAQIIRPKFELCYRYFEKLAAEIDGFEYSKPNGGYFINVNVPCGKARETVLLASDAGLKLTTAGASFPNGYDPDDRNIRICPTYPDINELEEALKLFTLCVKLACGD